MIRLSRAQLREVDRIAVEEYAMPSLLLMENAARSAADAIERQFRDLSTLSIAIVCGTGNNGGDGYALARHLATRGCHVDLVESGEPRASDAATMAEIAYRMKIERTSVCDMESLSGGIDLWVDAMFGTGLSRQLSSPWREATQVMNESKVPAVALDLPSGLDCDTGEPFDSDVCVRAAVTVAFVAEKLGFANARARAFVGDIGCPREIVAHVSKM